MAVIQDVEGVIHWSQGLALAFMVAHEHSAKVPVILVHITRPTGEPPSGGISYSTHGYSISLWEANYMHKKASGLSPMADGSLDLFLT